MPDPLWLVVAALAAVRLTRLIVADGFPPVKAVRDWLLRRWPSEDAEFPAAEVVDVDAYGVGELATGVRVVAVDGVWVAVTPHWLGELVTCWWCSGFWMSLGVAAVLPGVSWPVGGLLVAFALSAVVGWLGPRV